LRASEPAGPALSAVEGRNPERSEGALDEAANTKIPRRAHLVELGLRSSG